MDTAYRKIDVDAYDDDAVTEEGKRARDLALFSAMFTTKVLNEDEFIPNLNQSCTLMIPGLRKKCWLRHSPKLLKLDPF
jgi:hypothetical protein